MPNARSLLLCAVLTAMLPRLAMAQQIVIRYTDADEVSRVRPLAHEVPVGTVIRSSDVAIALTKPQSGDGFVLGAAKLDLAVAPRPMIYFTMTNGAESPTSLSAISAAVWRVTAADDGRIAISCMAGRWLSTRGRADRPVEPRATISVELPIAPECGPTLGETVGFLVELHSDGVGWYRAQYSALQAQKVTDPDHWSPYPEEAEQKAFLRRAFEKLASLSRQ